MKNIAVFSPHPILTLGFATITARSDEFHSWVCTEGSRLADASGVFPDIVLIDVTSGTTMSKLSEMKSLAPRAAIVLWVDSISTEFAAQALRLGVLGILPKDSSVQLHLEYLRRVAAGEVCLENELKLRLLRNKEVRLTPRERQIAALLAQGLKNKEIAYRLGIVEGTVKVCLSRLYDKTGTSDRFEFALFVLKNLGTEQATVSNQLPVFLPGFMNIERLPAGVQ